MGIAPSISCKLNYLCHYFDFSIPCSLCAILMYDWRPYIYNTKGLFVYFTQLEVKTFF